MELNEAGLKNKEAWKRLSIELPVFNREVVIEKTKKEPGWLHFGPGNIFRAFIASLQQTLLNEGETEFGIIAAAPNNSEIIDKIYQPHDNLSLLVTMCQDQSMRRKVIGSITEGLVCNPIAVKDWKRLQQIICASSLQIISFTITEKGYKLHDSDGNYLPTVKQDVEAGPKNAKSFPAKLTALLYERYRAGSLPVTLLSMDNCSHNGIVLQKTVLTIGEAWEKASLVENGFAAYLKQKISYPCTMIDKITPRPADNVQAALAADGFTDMDFVTSSRGGQYAPFVNAEKTEYLVIEDVFANGRPPLEKAGVIFTDRSTVDKVERMKVCTCLNPLHTALAVYGCLLGYTLIADEMKNPFLKKLVEKIGCDEGMKVVTNPGVLSPQDFLMECLNERFPNPAIPDTPQRIACDTSQKVGVRFGETIKEYVKAPQLDAAKLVYIPLAIAGWCRYLLGVDDEGNDFAVSPDPLLPQLQEKLMGIRLGEEFSVHQKLQAILSDSRIFGSNLYEAGIGTKIEKYFQEMTVEKGAVAATLKKYLS
ncbi:MAG: mannitol dehydrogenase family protein [Selenomonadaceae bacterium]